jgi:hypothetical protein
MENVPYILHNIKYILHKDRYILQCSALLGQKGTELPSTLSSVGPALAASGVCRRFPTLSALGTDTFSRAPDMGLLSSPNQRSFLFRQGTKTTNPQIPKSWNYPPWWEDGTEVNRH